MVDTLVVYFSFTGHTRKVAEDIADRLGADIAEIKVVEPYDGTYDEVVDQARGEVESKKRPPIKALECHFEDYKTIIVGSPVWWHSFAPAVGTFFDDYDLDGTRVGPFVTDEGELGHALEDMNDACPNSEVMGGLEVRYQGDAMLAEESVIKDWVANIQRSLLENSVL